MSRNRAKKNSGRGRNERDLGRRPISQRPRNAILIVCEAQKTEPCYFRALKKHLEYDALAIEPAHGGQSKPSYTVRHAIALRREREMKRTDQVWCVIDIEGPADGRDIESAIVLARKNRINLALSNPSFEYWFLLHFECCDPPYANAAELITHLRRHMPNYDKAADTYQSYLRGKTRTALDNAQALRTRAVSLWDKYPNPSTHVDRLVTAILEAADASADNL